MSAEGIWDLSISTPIGRIAVELDIRRENGTLVGTASGAGERVSLHDIVLDGDRLTWNQAVRKPMRVNLTFAVTVEGDALTGTAKAGRLPGSKVTGVRRGGSDHIR